MDSTQWYVAVGGNTVGPVSTELLLRGLSNGKVPTDALVCALGDAEWKTVAAVPPFSHEVFGAPRPHRATPPPPSDPFASARAIAPRHVAGATRRSGGPATADALPSLAIDDPRSPSRATTAGSARPAAATGSLRPPSLPILGRPPTPLPPPAPGRASAPPRGQWEPPPGPTALFGPEATAESGTRAEYEPPDPEPPPSAPPEAAEARGSVPDVDVLFDPLDDETNPRFFNWQQRIVDYFHDVSSLPLPEDGLLIGSLPTTSTSILIQEDAMWNLALCLAFGSDRLANAVAAAFFNAQQAHGEVDGIDWMTRTLLSRGFMPSGIPAEAGERALGVLRKHCPTGLRAALEKAVWD